MIPSLHDEAQELSAQAEMAGRSGDRSHARDLYRQAARLEREALSAVAVDKRRTRGLLGVSYASLLFKAGEYAEVEAAVCALLASPLDSPFKSQLRELLLVSWEEQELAREGVQYSGCELLVALRGGEIGVGSAPANVALHSMNAMNLLAVRATEFEAGLELRRQGPPSQEIQNILQARVTQPVAGSYRFSLRFVEPAQQPLFPEAGRIRRPAPKRIAETVLRVLRVLTNEDTAGFERLVPRSDYRLAFAGLARNLMPSGNALGEVEVRSAVDTPAEAVYLRPDQRRHISETIKTMMPAPLSNAEARQKTLRGTLRGLSLDQSWLEIRVENELKRIEANATALDDVIGPMVNRPVAARVEYPPIERKGRSGWPRLIDIELLED